MDKAQQILDKFNNLSPLKKLAFLTLIVFSVMLLLLLIVAAITPKSAPSKILPPIPVFNPSPTSQPGISSIKLSTPSVVELQGLSVSSPSIKDNFIYYLSDGASTFYKASLDGKIKQPLTDSLIAQIKQTVWSPDKSSAILKIENNKYFLGKNNSPFLSQEDNNLAITNWYYDLSKGSSKKLDSRIEPIVFSPDGKKLAYLKRDENDNLNKIYLSDFDGINEQLITTLPEIFQDHIVFLNNEQVLTYATPHGYGRNFIYLTNLNDKTFQKLIDNEFTFGAKPAPRGNLVLAQTVEKDPEVFYKSFLSVIDVQNRKLLVLDIQTSPELAAWSSDGATIYALEPGKLWVIDANTLSKQLTNLPIEFQNIKADEDSVLVSSDNNTLFFTSEGTLYKLSLKQ